MRQSEVNEIANNCSTFSQVYTRVELSVKNPMEVATYIFTKVMSQSEYAITPGEMYEVAVKEWNKKNKVVD